jgi:hypothetical protein
VALGVLVGSGSTFGSDLAAADALHAELARRACTSDDQHPHERAAGRCLRRERVGMIALGMTGAALVSAGTALLIRGAKQRRRTQLGFDLRHNRVGLTIAGTF